MNFGTIIKATCENVAPPADSRCSDPAFALAHPDICPVAPFLVLKPAVGLVCTLGSIQLRAVFTKDGVEEDVTEDTIFSSSDPDVAVVGATSGNATGVSEGSVTFRAVYNDGTNDHEAFSEINVLGDNCCDEQSVAIMVCVDNSKSMSLSFGAGYTTRLAFAKAAATRFINEVNETKDVVGLLKFNDALTEVLSEPAADKASVSALVPAIPQTQQITSFYECVTQAILSLDSVSGADRRIIVIISDGEDSTASYNDSNNPIAALDDFKSSGGIVMCLGVRAHGRGFALLSRFSTGGFFVNGYGTTASDALDYISGLKGYVCAGNCVPEGDEYVPTGAFNYDGFANWDVENGYVDLQGAGFFDYLPGNGMYVDLISGMQPSGSSNGRLVLKDAEAIAIEEGKDYRLTVSLAGNQQVDRSDTVKVQVFYKLADVDETPVYLLNQVIGISDYTSDFSNHSFAFTADADRTVWIAIQQVNVPTGDYARAGVLLGSVVFDDVTDASNLFSDDFDTENLEYVPPACGTGTVYTESGYISGSAGCYGTGCLDEPPAEQLQDPNPLPDIESGSNPPTTYTSTKTKCADCGSGFVNLSETVLEATLTDSETGPPKTCTYELTDGAAILRHYAVYGPVLGLQVNGFELYGSNNGSTWTLLDAVETMVIWDSNAPYLGYLGSNATAYLYYQVRFDSVSPDTGDFSVPPFTLLSSDSLFGIADDEACATATETSEVSQQNADQLANESALAAARAQLNCVQVFTATVSVRKNCPVGTVGQSVTKSATATSLVSEQEAIDKATLEATEAALAELNCEGSNNDQRLCILDESTPNSACDFRTGEPAPTKADPYPSVAFISGMSGLITKVTVTLKKLTHGSPSDICAILVSPSGTIVELMKDAGGDVLNVQAADITFDDDAAGFMPDPLAGNLTVTCKPTHGVGQINFPSPGPASPFALTLASFIGESPNGAWLLYVVDDTALDCGSINNGWTLQITTA